MHKVALITAASKGMGAACARELNKAGYRLGLMARSEEVLILAEELGAAVVRGSVTEKEDLKKLVNVTMGEFGRIDAVVNNTGHPAKGNLLTLTEADWREGLDLILLNITKMTQLIVPVMERQGGGAFVNISTFAAFEPSAAFPVSSVLRAALGSYTKLFANEYASKGIRMNSVLPGYIDSYQVTDAIRQAIPMGRAGTVMEVAKTVKFLLSDDAGYITGQNIKVDGGISRSI